MKNTPYILLIFITIVLLIATGCPKKTPTQIIQKSEDSAENIRLQTTVKNNLETEDEKSIYDTIIKYIENNLPYKINFSESNLEKGQIKYDFNNDKKTEILEYSVIKGKNYYKNINTKIIFNIAGSSLEQNYFDEYEEGIVSIGVVDINKQDNYVEFFTDNGFLRGGVSVVYRLIDNDIQEIARVDGGILATSGDGKIYYWGGNLYEEQEISTAGRFNSDLVLSCYDIDKKEYVNTKQIIGKTIISDREIRVYKRKEDLVTDGPPMTEEEINQNAEGKLVKIIEKNMNFKVLSIENGIKIRTEDGKVGWIGGFHMVAD